MPELVPKEMLAIQDKLKAERRQLGGGFIFDEKIAEIVGEYDRDYVGHGAECVVIGAPLDPTRKWWEVWKGQRKPIKDGEREIVTAVDYSYVKDPIQAKKIFYAQRVMSTLFPHNFPRFFAAYGDWDKARGRSGQVRERVETKSNLDGVYTLDKTSEYPFGKAERTAKELKMPVFFDQFEGNYGKGVDGGVYFLDRIVVGEGWDLPLVMRYMNRHHYNEKEKWVVRKSIERLEQLDQMRKTMRNTDRASRLT